MGGGQKIEIPDWKQYKVEGLKDLEWTRNSLAARGLKDPWLRNEVWRYQDHPGVWGSMRITMTRGLKWAVAAMVVTIAVDKMFGISDKRAAAAHHHH